MKRKDFLKKLALGAAGASLAPLAAQARPNNSTTEKERKSMQKIIHKSNSRGHANHGWLDSHHTFSFANYYNPDRMHFGVLRVLNDDVVAPGKGFGRHPHDNMEIISIPLSGDLEHKDSMGNVAVIREGDVQVMSAGTGIFHSEYNKREDREVKFLQIWVYPNKKNVKPRYDQIALQEIARENEFYQILSPDAADQGVWIHQEAWFHLGRFTKETGLTYSIKKPGNGTYFFVLDGEVEIAKEKLNSRDGLGIWDTESVELTCHAGSRVLVMEVPMTP